MDDQLAVPGPEKTRAPEAYPVGYEPKTVEYFATRRAAQKAAFFLPYLSPGLSLLDCGCDFCGFS